MLGGRDDLRDLLFQSMVGAGALAGELYILENINKEILSMALWFAPGEAMFSSWVGTSRLLAMSTIYSRSELQRSKGFNDLMKELDGETKVWWKDQVSSCFWALNITFWLISLSMGTSWANTFRRCSGRSLSTLSYLWQLVYTAYQTPLDSWWLNVLATEPNHQGKGYATTLTHGKISQVCQPPWI